MRFLNRIGQKADQAILSSSRNLKNLNRHIVEFDTFMNKKELQKLLDQANEEALQSSQSNGPRPPQMSQLPHLILQPFLENITGKKERMHLLLINAKN